MGKRLGCFITNRIVGEDMVRSRGDIINATSVLDYPSSSHCFRICDRRDVITEKVFNARIDFQWFYNEVREMISRR